MQYRSQEHTRTDGILDQVLIISIGGKIQFVCNDYTLIQNLDNYVGINQVFQDSFLKNLKENYICFHDMGHIEYIENLQLSSVEQKICNNQGLIIYCTEQIVHTAADQQRLIIDGKHSIPNIKINWEQNSTDEIWSPTLQSIDIFVKNNKLTNVTVCTSFADTFDIYKNKYNFKLSRKDPYINAVATILDKNKTPLQIIDSKKINTRFWCGNWGYRPHRHLVTAFASTLDTKYSWGYTDTNYGILFHLWFDYTKFEHKKRLFNGLENLEPKFIDIPLGAENINGNVYDLAIRPAIAPEGPDILDYSSRELFSDTFIGIINSSSFGEPFPVYDEKPLNAIINFRPFIMIGPPGSLALMRKDGFRTFNEFWNEGYDEETNHQARLEKIFDLLLDINSWSIEKCQSVHTQMHEILFHNYNLIGPNLQS